MTANCAPTSASRRIQRRPPARATATAPFRSRTTFGRVAPSAGTRPAATPAPAANAAVNRKARVSRRNSKVIENGPMGSSAAATVRSRLQARVSPAPAPRHDRTRLSVNNCRTRRPRLAPTASRTPISRRRAAARASSMPMTFAHATSRTTPTSIRPTAPTTYAGPAVPAGRRAFSVRVNDTRRPSPESGSAAARPAMITSRLASACTSVTPSRSLPLTYTGRCRCPRRSGLVSLPAAKNVILDTSSIQVIGIHRSGPSRGSMPANPGGATPTTRYGWDRMRRLRPTTSGSRPKARSHSPLEITATRATPGRSSSDPSIRPSTG